MNFIYSRDVQVSSKLSDNMLRKRSYSILILGMLSFLSSTVLQAQNFTAGNLALFIASASATNTTGSIVEINTTNSAQSAITTRTISGTGTDAMRFSGSATSTAYLSNSNDGTLLCFTGVNNIDATSNVNTLNPRAVGSFNNAGAFIKQTTYTGTSGNQTRCATTLNNSNWFIGDQSGVYTNSSTTASPAGNFRGVKAFGGTVYTSSSSSTATVIQVGTLASTTGATYTGLNGLTNNASIQDFYLISSGSNGSIYDILYTLSATSNTAGTIAKYSLVGSTWTSNGTYTTTFGGFGLAAKKSGSGAELYITTGQGALTANSVLKATDAAGYNAAISITTANNVTLYTAATGTIIKGIAFAPVVPAGAFITTTGSFNAFSTIYGNTSASQSITVNGSNLTASISATAPAGFEVSSDNINYGATATYTQTAGVATGVLYVRLSASVLPGTYAGNVVLSSTGATNFNVAIPSSNVSKKALTISGATANGKIYDGNASATISNSILNGIVGSDVVTVTNSGTFSSSNAGSAINVTSTQTLAGANSSNYTLTLPTGLSADITPKVLTISGLTANNKVYDGSTTTTLSGTPSLTGIVGSDNVTLSGTPIANFVSPNIGSGIAVIVNGYTLSGTSASNYTVQQPIGLTADITATPTPVITSTLALSITYGTPMIGYNITATNSPITYNALGLPAGLTVNTQTGEISGIPSEISGSPYMITIQASNAGGTGMALLQMTIVKKDLTIANATALSKVYDRNSTASISGNLSGVYGSDVVSFNGTGTFAQVNVGVGLTVTSTCSLTGADIAKYNLVQPVGLVADITPAPLTISNAAAQSKLYDGTTAATLTGTLSGVISPDAVVLTLSGVFATSNVGNGIAVTSTSTISGVNAGNYSLIQPVGLSANILNLPSLTEIILPQYIQGLNGTNATRVPYAFRVKISNLLANATYRFTNQVVISSDLSTVSGAGNCIFVSASGFTRTTSPSLATAGNYGSFTTNSNGEYTGWFAVEPTGNATRFAPGTNVLMRISLNDGNGGTTAISRVTTTSSIKVINFANTSGINNGSGLRGLSSAIAKNFVFAYDNVTGSGRPLSGTFVESDGTANTTANSYVTFYNSNVDGINGAYGMIIPNNNANGVQRFEQYDLNTGAMIGCAKDNDGIWPSGANTVNPTNGTTAVAITSTDAPLNNCDATLTLKCYLDGYYVGAGMMNTVLMNQAVVNAGMNDCDSITVELHNTTSPYNVSYSFSGRLQTNGTLSCSFPGTAIGSSYYLVVKSRNALETWSAAPISISTSNSYDFSTASTQAYGSNQMEVDPGVWAFYTGDMNQDGAIDAFDYLVMDPDIQNGNSGYLSTDLNGDGSVDAFDYIVYDPKSYNGVTIQTP